MEGVVPVMASFEFPLPLVGQQSYSHPYCKESREHEYFDLLVSSIEEQREGFENGG